MFNKDLFIPINTQLALYFANGNSFKALNAANIISENFSSVFSTEPMVIPLPPQAPPEIPRISITQQDVGSLNISYARADLSLLWNANESWVKQIVDNGKLLATSIEKLNIRPMRMGFVVISSLPDNITVNEFKKQYINSNKLDDAIDMKFAWSERCLVEGIDFNLWVVFNFNSNKNTNNNLVTIDFNAPPEKKLNLEPLLVGKIIESCLEKIGGDFNAVVHWN